MIRFFRCENPKCKKEFSLIDGNKDSPTSEACPFCGNPNVTLLRREGFVSGKRKTKAPDRQEDFLDEY